MGSKQTKTTTTNQAPAFVPKPASPWLDAADQMVDQIDYTSPITQAHGQAINDINEGSNNIFGPNTTPEAADKVRKGRLFAANTQYGQDMSDAVARTNEAKISGKLAIAQGHEPIVYNPGSTVTTKQPVNWMGGVSQGLQSGIKVASMF